MKYLAIVVIITLCLGGGYSIPAKLSAVSSSGLICPIDDDGNTVECDEENSQLPDNLDTDGAVASDEYACLDITYKTGILLLKKTHHVMQCAYQLKGQRLCTVLTAENDVSECTDSEPDPKPDPTTTTEETPSGLYCQVDDLDNTVECSLKNSVLPDDLDAGDYSKSTEYVCVDILYRTGLINLISHHVRQCALQLVDEDLCDVLEDKNTVPSCSQSTPYTSPTIIPPSGKYCEVDSDGDTVQCCVANSVLPSDLSIGSAEESSSYVCLSVTYQTGLILKKTKSTRQCALELDGDKDLCSVLQDNNDIQKCRLYDPTEE